MNPLRPDHHHAGERRRIGLYDDGEVAGLDLEEMNSSLDVMEEIVSVCDASIERMTFISTPRGRITVLYIESNTQTDRRFHCMGREDDAEPQSEHDCEDIIGD